MGGTSNHGTQKDTAMQVYPASLKCPKCARTFQREQWNEWFRDNRAGVVTRVVLHLVVVFVLITVNLGCLKGWEEARHSLFQMARLACDAWWLLPLFWFLSPSIIHRHHTGTEKQTPAQRRWMRRWAPVIIYGFAALAMLTIVWLSAPGRHFSLPRMK